MFTISAPRITIRFVALLTAVSLVLSAFPAAFFVANAQDATTPVVEIIETPVEEVPEVVEKVVEEVPAAPEAAAAIVIAEPPVSALLVADKIICDDESVLPNWGSNSENPSITADTAENWVAEHSDDCYFAKGWEFEWAVYGTVGNPGDTLVGSAGAPWTTFSNSTTIPESAFEAGIWVREVLQAGYIPYTYNPEKVNTNDVSAEIYCNTDVVNYDNFDYVGGIEPEATYYCVAWNVLAEEPEGDLYEITGTKWNDRNYNGTREEGEEGLAGWTIVAQNGENTVSTTTDVNGDYTLWVPAGDWTVGETQQEGWSQTSTRQNGDYLGESYTCSFSFGDLEPVLYKSLSSELLDVEIVDVDSNSCDFGNRYYYETITACKLDENKNPVEGWAMYVQSYETEEVIELTTGENGCVSIDVDPYDGPWIVEEGFDDEWSQLDVDVNNGEIYNYEGEDDRFCVFYDYELSRAEVSELQVVDGDYDDSRTCTFTNQAPEKKDGSSSSGTRTKRPQGQVLGATTQCGLWLNDYMQKATVNDTYQVLKLQVFLTLQGYATPLTGIFDDATEANVKLFQAKYAGTVIKPWFDKGIVPHNRPTGFVYKTTRWQINDIMCPGIEAYPSFEGENLSTNVLISR